MKKHVFRISVVLLVILLAVVSFYMLYVHVPYYDYHNGIDYIRNDICEKNHYEYMDYFSEYRGNEVFYMLKVKIDGVESYVAYNQKQELVDTYQGEVANEDDVKKAILDKYEIQVEQLEIGYENNKFVYYYRYHSDQVLLYVYYDLKTGEFIKAVKLGE